MLSSFSFWIWGTIIAQFLTAAFHSLSFIAPAKPRNDMEKQLIDITTNYKLDMGAGFKRSFYNLFVGVSSCFTLIFILGGVLNWYFLKAGITADVWKGFLLIQLLIMGWFFFYRYGLPFCRLLLLRVLYSSFLQAPFFFPLCRVKCEGKPILL